MPKAKQVPCEISNATSVPIPSGAPTSISASDAILTVSEVAALLKLAPSSIYELTRFRAGRGSATIPCRKIGRNLRFLRSEIEAYVIALPKVAHTQKRNYRKRSAEQVPK